MPSDTPPWFTRAVQVKADVRHTQHDGVKLHYRTWGNPARPGVILVHGGAAHSHWWDFIAPSFAEHYFVVALDLSGHGESGRRQSYPLRTWVSELLAVMDDVGFAEKPALVGHSMGGILAVVAAALAGDRFAGAVVVDAPVRAATADAEAERASRTAAFRSPRVYRDRESAVRAFGLVPPQPCANDFIVRYIAEHSLRAVEGGYTWKFDPAIVVRTAKEPLERHLVNHRCPLALVVGAQSEVVDAETLEHMRGLLGEDTPVARISDAYHHVMLDQPQAFIQAVTPFVAGWL